MTVSQHVEKRLLRGLRFLAEAELAGRTLTARQLGLELGMSETAGLETRQLLLATGLLVPLQSRKGGAPRVKLSDDGWRALGETPPAAPVVVPMVTRRCLRCGGEFASDGPHNRICTPCKGTDDWQSASSIAASVSRPHRGGPRA